MPPPPPPAAAAADLGLGPDDAAVKLVHLRAAGGVPLLLETSYLPAARFGALADAGLERQSLYALLEHRLGVRRGHA